jgi:two-component system, chemotaxis family, CheB/CheR fusion protein
MCSADSSSPRRWAERALRGNVADGVVDGAGLELVLNHLKDSRAFDFTGYKRATLARRVEKRMGEVGIGDHDDYVDFLEVHPEEFEPLFNTILINVTSFFRDADAWDVLRETVLPELLERKPEGPLRIWSAGCSSGQEAYSVVMLLAELIGVEAVTERVKVYATDVDEEALEQARLAAYTAREMESVPDELADRYFDRSRDGAVFSPELRRTVIFGRHDLLQDAPISRVDLLLCRNTLMYFDASVQHDLVQRLHFSLADGGYLMLGKVEMLLGQGQVFEPVATKQRIFRKITVPTMRGRLLAMAGRVPSTDGELGTHVLESAFEHGADPEMVLDAQSCLLAVNERARSLFGLSEAILGRPFQDLEISYRPADLRSAIDEAANEHRPVRLSEVPRWTPTGELTFLDISVAPLASGDDYAGAVVSFVDVTRHRQVQEELEQTHRELEVAYEELQSANEELETTNEELQSTIEELETTNEELQSTNEELETMNEELSSTNEELHAINEELRDRTTEVDQVNAYLESVLTSIDASVVVVDPDMKVRVWNGLSFEMWGLRSEEVEGKSFLNLEIGFPVESLRPALAATLAGDGVSEAAMFDATSRRGQAMRCLARISPLTGAEGAVEGAIVIIEEIHPA